MFGFCPLRCLRSLVLSGCSLWHSLSSPPANVRYLARTKSHAHSRTKMKVYADLRICYCCSPAFHLPLFRAYPVPGCRSNPQTMYTLPLSFFVCGPSLAFFRDFGNHGRYTARGYMCQTTPPFPSSLFSLFPFSISTTIRNMAAQFASQPRCTIHNPQSTSHYPYASLTPHPTCHRSAPLEIPNSSSN